MLGFIFKRAESGTRRSVRLWVMRMRRYVVPTVVFSVAVAGIVVGVHNGTFARVASSFEQKAIDVSFHSGFKVNQILVTGRHEISTRELMDKLGVNQGMPLFAVDLTAARERVLALSWVKDVSVSRRLPDKVVVELRERRPIALWQYQKKISVIDGEGVLLTSKDLTPYQNLPLLVGEDAHTHALELLSALRTNENIGGETAAAVRVGGRRWDLHLRSGLTIKLPEGKTDKAIRQLADMEEKQKILEKHISMLDLRLPDIFTVEAEPYVAPVETSGAAGSQGMLPAEAPVAIPAPSSVKGAG